MRCTKYELYLRIYFYGEQYEQRDNKWLENIQTSFDGQTIHAVMYSP